MHKLCLDMETQRYSLSFTSASLLHRESLIIAELCFQLNDWNLVRAQVIDQNLLQVRTLNTSKRFFREVASRLKTLSSTELELLVNGTLHEQRYLLWLAICRRYRFIGDFAREVLRENFISLKTCLSYEDFDAFFNRRAEWHEELEQIKPATQVKLRRTLFQMMREADLLSPENLINPALLSSQLLQAIPKERYQDLFFFPAFESDLVQWAH